MKHDGGIADVDHLDERKARGMTSKLLLAERRFELFPVLLRRGDGMIAVRDRKHGIPLGVQHIDDVRRDVVGDKPARQMPAAFHEVEVVQFFQLFAQQALDRFVLFIAVKDESMRKLKRRCPAQGDAEGKAAGDDLFGGAHGRHDSFLCAERLQIDADEDAAAHARTRGALGEDEAARQFAERVVLQGRIHGGADFLDARRVVLAEVRLGQNKVERRGRVPDAALYASPVFAIGRELIAGDDRPCFKTLPRQEDARDAQTCPHIALMTMTAATASTAASSLSGTLWVNSLPRKDQNFTKMPS